MPSGPICTLSKPVALAAVCALAWAPAPCSAQSTLPALFVVNNGSAGSGISSFRIGADGAPTFVDNLVPGGSLNPQCIDLSPNGRWLCVGHGTESSINEQLTFVEVGVDASLTMVLEATTPDSPVGVKWLDDQHVVVTNTSASPNDQLIVYRFDPNVPSSTQVWFSVLSTSTFDIAISRQHRLLFPRASISSVWPMTWDNKGELTKLTATPVSTGIYYIGPGVSPDGTKLYFGGGISSGGQPNSGRWISGFNVDTGTGALTPMPNAPFLSPPSSGISNVSPKQVVVSTDGNRAFAAHGASGDVQGFNINQASGELTVIPASFHDVGGQGNCSRMAMLNNRLYVLRYYSNPTPGDGILAFDINADGTLSQIGGVVPTQGSLPWDIVAWPGPPQDCPEDIDGSGAVNVTDLLAVISAWGRCRDCAADIDDSGTVDVTDLLAVISAWGQCPNQ